MNGIPVVRRTAFHGVGDKDFRPVELHRIDHARQEFPGTPDEGKPLKIFIRSGSLPEKHQLSFRVAISEHRIRPGAAEFAAAAHGNGIVQFVPCHLARSLPGRCGNRRRRRNIRCRNRRSLGGEACVTSRRHCGAGGSLPDRRRFNDIRIELSADLRAHIGIRRNKRLRLETFYDFIENIRLRHTSKNLLRYLPFQKSNVLYIRKNTIFNLK